MEIWFNPRCSKCRQATALLDEAGADYTVRRYLEDSPSPGEIEGVLAMLNLEPWEITRMKEPLAVELGLADLARDRGRWIALLAENPSLIQRPIIVDGDRAVVGRSEDAVRSLLP
jgi:arsenate reductase